jgi:hypothetical protein
VNLVKQCPGEGKRVTGAQAVLFVFEADDYLSFEDNGRLDLRTVRVELTSRAAAWGKVAMHDLDAVCRVSSQDLVGDTRVGIRIDGALCGTNEARFGARFVEDVTDVYLEHRADAHERRDRRHYPAALDLRKKPRGDTAPRCEASQSDAAFLPQFPDAPSDKGVQPIASRR